MLTGIAPLLISQPHGASALPPELVPRLTAAARRVADTDWHIQPLYAPVARVVGASCLSPAWSRYAIDLNRDPDGLPLYPGASETGLCPVDSFAGEPLYTPDDEPGAVELAERRARWWQPYHAALAAELARLHALHGYVLLFDAHSIASRVPRFFDGQLPDFNFGSGGGRTLPAAIMDGLLDTVQRDGRFSAVANARFKGGYITRHYAVPQRHVYSLQLELSQAVYLDEAQPDRWDADRAAVVQPLLLSLLRQALDGCARAARA